MILSSGGGSYLGVPGSGKAASSGREKKLSSNPHSCYANVVIAFVFSHRISDTLVMKILPLLVIPSRGLP